MSLNSITQSCVSFMNDVTFHSKMNNIHFWHHEILKRVFAFKNTLKLFWLRVPYHEDDV